MITTDELKAVIRFIDEHANDSNVLSAGDQQASSGMPEGLRNNFEKYKGSLGWRYSQVLQSYPLPEEDLAHSFAKNFYEQVQLPLTALGFSTITDNPWPTFTMTKSIGYRKNLQIWISVKQDKESALVVLSVSPNIAYPSH